MKRSSVGSSVGLSVSSTGSRAACGRFATERPAGRKYRSVAAGALQAPAPSSKCGQQIEEAEYRLVSIIT